MWFQEYQRFEFLQIIADIMTLILKTMQPFVTPIGAWMVSWVGFLLKYFPTNSLAIYIVLFVALIVSGIIINLKWPGEKFITVYTKEESNRDIEGNKSSIEFYDNDE